jgi:threonine synthase
LTVTDQELMVGVEELARWQGVHAAPEGGAVWMAAKRLLRDGWIQPKQSVVLFNTGAAVKYNHLLKADGLQTLDHRDPAVLDQLQEN